MDTKPQVRLAASEIATLWTSCLNNSLSICMLKFQLTHVDDKEIQEVLEFALAVAENSLVTSRELLKADGQTIPVGFTEADMNLSAPRLYSDAFYLYYLKNMSKVGISIYGVAMATSAHARVREFLSEAISSTTKLYNLTADTLLRKWLFIRTPYITTPDHIEYIEEKGYMRGLLTFHKRPLNVIEITHIQANIETNVVGQGLLAGLAQVAETKSVREYCYRGKEIAKKHVQIFNKLLIDDDLPAATPWDVEVSASTTAPVSDKIILFLSTLLNASGISNYATASAASLRTDVATAYIRLSAEVAEFSKDGANLLIEHGWLEQPPQAIDRKQLSQV